MNPRCIVIGAGGHGKVIADILLSGGTDVLGFLDDNFAGEGQSVLGLPILGKPSSWNDFSDSHFIVAIGSQKIRQQMVIQLQADGQSQWLIAIHPSATVSTFSTIGVGSVVMAGAVINADAVIGIHSIVNTSATVDHDCVVGDFVHIAPGANLAGGVQIGDRTLVGVGATIAPYCTVGEDVIIGAGAVVIDNIASGRTVKGVPAK